ncbi:MAG: hypothetical protein EAZ57_00500 [Cytophagales bacterium]|nr:MAG: hypothetical protein EAZ67_00630 [Cytophagales bacterium]TAF62270.1 MAG: hypothetical protein EAZ57_00500 [Cytophagales bacterium]
MKRGLVNLLFACWILSGLCSCSASSESASSVEVFYQNLSKDDFKEAIKSFDHVLFQMKSEEAWVNELTARQKVVGSLKSFELLNPMVAEQENMPMLTLRYQTVYENTTMKESVTLIRGKNGYLISAYTFSDLVGCTLYDPIRANQLDSAIMVFDTAAYDASKRAELRSKLSRKCNVMGIPTGFTVLSAAKEGDQSKYVFEVAYPKGSVREEVVFSEYQENRYRVMSYNYDISKEEAAYKAKLDSTLKQQQGGMIDLANIPNGTLKSKLNLKRSRPIPQDGIVVKEKGS